MLSSVSRVAPLRTALLVLLIALLPNVVLAVVETWLFMNRPIIVYEYFVVALAALVLPLPLALALFSAVVVVDLFVAFSPGFHFSIESLAQSLSGVSALEPGALLRLLLPSLGALCVLVLVVALLVRRLSLSLRSLAASVALCTAAVVALDAADSRLSPTNKRRAEQAPLDRNVAGAVYIALRKTVRMSREPGTRTGRVIESASQPLFDALRDEGAAPDNLVLIVVESMSLYKEAAANALQAAPLLEHPDVIERFDVTSGTVGFAGPTKSGELRELCNSEFLLAVPLATDVPTERCLPTLARQAGYDVVGVNGYYASFFNTGLLYRESGMDEVYFAGAVADATGDGGKCGSTFRGSCDDDAARFLADLISSRSAAGKRNLYYWLTLNGHLPVSVPPSYDGSIDCDASRTTAEHEGICASVQTSSIVLREIATTVIGAIDPAQRTTIVVVADHAAPFVTRDIREALDTERVPFFVLKSRPPASP